jgi:regulator of replication initiation timing
LGKGLDHLKEDDLAGAAKGAFGVNNGVKPNGMPFNHLGEVEQTLRDMGKQLLKLRTQIDGGVYDGDALKAAESLYKEVLGRQTQLKKVVTEAKNVAKEFKD